MGGRGSKSASARGAAKSVDYLRYLARPSVYGTVTRRQAGVVFRAYKEGRLPSASNGQMSMMYGRYVDGRGDGRQPTTDMAMRDVADRLRTVVNATMAHDYAAADAAFQDFVSAHYIRFDDMVYPDTRGPRPRR